MTRKMLIVIVLFLGSGVAIALFIASCAQPYYLMDSGASTGATKKEYLGSPASRVGTKNASRMHRAALPGSMPSPDEELWIIQRPDEPAVDDDAPGCGALLAVLPGEEKQVPVPLKHTNVQAQISAYIATVDVTQHYTNPYASKIEAVYLFPLPQNAAVNEFLMTVGDRRIRGIIREREEAEKIYKEARRQGHVASLLTQERANVFTQKVANIEPGKNIDINIKYFHTLAYKDGWYEYVFPMVVGPRFNPPGSTDGIGAVARGQHGRSGQRTEVQYLKPHERSGHDISLAVNIDAGVKVEEVKCTSHVVNVKRPSGNQTEVRLSRNDVIPNKDFVLRYKVAGKQIKTALLTHEADQGGYFTLMLYPPENLRALQRKPMEMIFVLDCSGSMRGHPIDQAKTAIDRALKHLEPDDTFQVIRFSNNASQLGRTPLRATSSNLRKGRRYVRDLRGSGGTMAIEGVKAALDFPHDPRRLRFVSFMTDGYIGNEMQILGEVHRRLGASRIFSFGVGSSPNRYLLDRMAKLGRGAVAHLSLDDSAAPIMDRFFERISHPAMTDIAIDWGGLHVSEVFPSKIPDLFVGRPVIITGRYRGRASGDVRITGTVGDHARDLRIPIDRTGKHRALPSVWARTKIADLADRSTYEGGSELPGEIKQVALEYGLMSQYTAFVAVDSLSKTAGNFGTSVKVPVPMPDGVRYETTVTE
ncbi:MAG: VIT and VWA domain-containing protein [Phycisphaerales bacterium]|nr:VIT and VWA domain-containing protein [Phycisphaerales bacterium]